MRRDNFDHEAVDHGLSLEAGLRIREAVRALPDETLSLTWRSDLNERLAAAAGRRKKARLAALIWKPAAGLALAGALSVAFMVKTAGAPGSSSPAGLEDALVRNHLENISAFDVAGVGVTSGESEPGVVLPGPSEWDREDLTSL